MATEEANRMATSGDSGFRIKSIIVLVCFITIIYTAYGVFGSIQVQTYSSSSLTSYDYNRQNTSLDQQTLDENYNYDTSDSEGFIGMLMNIGSFLTFGNINNAFIRILFNTIILICGLVLGFIIYLFVRDWVPFV